MNKIKGIEIERKFWVSSLPPDYAQWPFTSIRQGYLSTDPEGTEVRIRKENSLHTLTIKSGEGLKRTEIILKLTQEKFSSLWALTSNRQIFKDRYKIQNNSVLLELDIFKGSLEGLYLVEIEFSSEASAELFHPLSWMTKEITGMKSFYNQNLWRYSSYEELREMLLSSK